jgi:hypothetical protein
MFVDGVVLCGRVRNVGSFEVWLMNGMIWLYWERRRSILGLL